MMTMHMYMVIYCPFFPTVPCGEDSSSACGEDHSGRFVLNHKYCK